MCKELSILKKDLTALTEKTLLELGLEITSVGFGSVEFSAKSKTTFDKAVKYLNDNKIHASI
jgi:hypothetical protein